MRGGGKSREKVKVDFGRNLRRVVAILRCIFAVGGIPLSLITGPLPLRHVANLLTGRLDFYYYKPAGWLIIQSIATSNFSKAVREMHDSG